MEIRENRGRDMNLKLTTSFFLPAVFMLLLIACGGESQIVDTPTPEAEVVAKAEVESSPTKEPPKPEPTNPSTPTEVPPTVIPTTMPSTSTPTHNATLTPTPTLTQAPPNRSTPPKALP